MFVANAQNAIWSRAFRFSITRNLITRVLTICHVKLAQSTTMEQKRFDLQSLSSALCDLYLLLAFKNFGSIKFSCILSHEPRKRQIPKLSRTNCVTIQLTVRASWHEPGWPVLKSWLALPWWLLFRYYMKRASQEPSFLFRDWKQCVQWSVLPACFIHWAARKHDYLENFHPGYRHHNTGIPAKRAGSVFI